MKQLLLRRLPVWTLASAALLVSLMTHGASNAIEARKHQRIAELANAWILTQQHQGGGFAHYWFDPWGGETPASHPQGQLIQAYWSASMANERPKVQAVHDRQIRSLEQQFGLTFREEPPTEFIKRYPSSVAMTLYLLAASPNVSSYRLFIETAIEQWRAQARLEADSVELSETSYREGLASNQERYFRAQMAAALMSAANALNNEEIGRAGTLVLADLIASQSPKTESPSVKPWIVEALRHRAGLSRDRGDEQKIVEYALASMRLQDKRDFPGRFWREKFESFGPPNTVRDARLSMVLLHGLEAAITLGDKRAAKKLKRGIVLGLDNLKAHQYRAGVVEAFPSPSSTVGAVRFRYNESLCRIDSTVETARVFTKAAELAGRGML
jgi:hypothetical protein